MAERADQILLVEGKDDQHVIWALLEYHGVAKVFKVHERGGVERLLESLPVQIKGSRSKTVGIVVDADRHLLSRWTSICSILNSLGYANIPKNAPPTGLITTHPHQPAFGAWIMPDNGLNGKLEDFVRLLIPSEDRLQVFVADMLSRLPPDIRLFADKDHIKAFMHAWLALQARPGMPTGQSITARVLDPETAIAGTFIGWIRRLFSSEET